MLPVKLNKLLVIVVVLSMALTPALNELGQEAAHFIGKNVEEEDIHIHARAKDIPHLQDLKEAGATNAILDNAEIGDYEVSSKPIPKLTTKLASSSRKQRVQSEIVLAQSTMSQQSERFSINPESENVELAGGVIPRSWSSNVHNPCAYTLKALDVISFAYQSLQNLDTTKADAGDHIWNTWTGRTQKCVWSLVRM